MPVEKASNNLTGVPSRSDVHRTLCTCECSGCRARTGIHTPIECGRISILLGDEQ